MPLIVRIKIFTRFRKLESGTYVSHDIRSDIEYRKSRKVHSDYLFTEYLSYFNWYLLFGGNDTLDMLIRVILSWKCLLIFKQCKLIHFYKFSYCLKNVRELRVNAFCHVRVIRGDLNCHILTVSLCKLT